MGAKAESVGSHFLLGFCDRGEGRKCIIYVV